MENQGKPWKMKKIKSRSGKVMENDNLAKSYGKVMKFYIFTNVSMSLIFPLGKYVDYIHF